MTFPGPFDVITAFRFFLNADQSLRERALMTIKMRMHANSILIINNHGSYPSLRSLTIRLRGKIGSPNINEIKRSNFENMLKSIGFAIVKRVGVTVFTPTISRLIGYNATRKGEMLFYQLGIARWLGSNQVYVLKLNGSGYESVRELEN